MTENPYPTADELRALLDYNPETGVLTWRARRKGMTLRGAEIPHANRLDNWNVQHAGTVAGGVGNRGYLQVGICGGRYLAHRMAWAIYHGEWPRDQIDHINGDKTDNRISNLRSVSNLENSRNQKMSKSNTSGITGVGWRTRDQKWAAYIAVKGRQLSLGYFDNIDDAIAARKAAERAANFHENHGRKF